jgi:alpha-galactosidase/6-phospho-beta-glucosidase family protein
LASRITIVGGGSAHWSPKLLLDFANTTSLHDAEVCLMDVDAASLGPMVELAGRIAKQRGIALSATSTTDLDAALEGAEFVVTAFSVGGFESMRHDLEIPARHGVRAPVGDSVGPGGISRALRSVPVIVDMARRMESRCPDALLLNVTNPLTALCRAVTRETSIATVGLCNEVVGQSFVLSLLLDVDMRTVDPVVAGVNHFPLVTELRIGDTDGFERIRAVLDDPEQVSREPLWMRPPAGMHWRKVSPGETWTKADVLANNRIKLVLFELFGVLPFASDTHIAEFLPAFVTESSDFGRDWHVHHYGLHGHEADKQAERDELADLETADEYPTWASGELVAPLIDGIAAAGRSLQHTDGPMAGRPSRSLPVNLPNTGQVGNVPPGAVVECVGVAGPEGVQPRDRAEVTSVLGEQLRRINVSQELTVSAALEGSETQVLEAVMADPFGSCLPFDRARRMTRELISATSEWLPQFSGSRRASL